MSGCVLNSVDAVRDYIKAYPDFTKNGGSYRDILEIFEKPDAFSTLHDALLSRLKNITPPIECVTAVEPQGFLFGPSLALSLKVPFVAINKKDSLPGKVRSVSYKYGSIDCSVEIEEGIIKEGTRVVLVDAILGEGFFMAAACQLLQEIGADLIECDVILELVELKGRNIIPVPVHSLIRYPELVLCCIS